MLGIYKDNGSVYPGALHAQSAQVYISGIGQRYILLSATLPKGLYWLGIFNSASVTISSEPSHFHQFIPIISNMRATYGGYSYPTTWPTWPDPYPAGVGGIPAILHMPIHRSA